MRGGARQGTGGAMPGAGRKPDATPTKPRLHRLTDDQHAMMKQLGGSPWLQGLLNLEIARQAAKPIESHGALAPPLMQAQIDTNNACNARMIQQQAAIVTSS